MNLFNVSKINSRHYVQLKEKKKEKNVDDNFDFKKSDPKKTYEDEIIISNESREVVENERSLMLEEIEEDFYLIEHFKEEMKAFNEEENPYADELKCLLIALRIINGDDVPEKDKNFLMEHKPEMYGNAILLRTKNKDPKKHKSLIEDDNKEDLEDLSSETQELISQLSSDESISPESSETSES